MRDECYIFIFNLITVANLDTIYALESKLSMKKLSLGQDLQVSKIFQLKNAPVPQEQPYLKTLDYLQTLRHEMSPLKKLEIIFNALKIMLPQEVDEH